MDINFCLAGHTPALGYAAQVLLRRGYSVCDSPGTQTTHLLLPVPGFEPDGSIKGGGNLEDILAQLPGDVVIFGGLLARPELKGYHCIDLLEDPLFTAQNANITAHCAVDLAMRKLPVILERQPVLVIGWGRIGKCLAQLLKGMGAQVTVAARKESDRVILKALGYSAVDTGDLDTTPYRVIFNTVPQMICPDCPGDGLKIDLASKLGLGGEDVIWARGLPGKDAPESSGQLIAETILRFIEGDCHAGVRTGAQ